MDSNNIMSIPNFYDRFHKSSKAQNKIIKDSNITYRIIISELNSILHLQNLKILDYGCGTGTLSYYFASKNNFVIGTDISNKAIEIANRSKFLLGLDNKCLFYSLKRINLLRNKYKNKFDLVICSEVIEHVHKDSALISTLRQYLKPGGYLFLTTPSINSPLYKMGLLNVFDKKVGHLRRYNKSRIEFILRKNGFKIIFFKKTEGILRNIFYTNIYFGYLLKVCKGPISDLFTFVDNLLIPIFGESNFHVLAQKP